jgi:hypothetical protein
MRGSFGGCQIAVNGVDSKTIIPRPAQPHSQTRPQIPLWRNLDTQTHRPLVVYSTRLLGPYILLPTRQYQGRKPRYPARPPPDLHTRPLRRGATDAGNRSRHLSSPTRKPHEEKPRGIGTMATSNMQYRQTEQAGCAGSSQADFQKHHRIFQAPKEEPKRKCRRIHSHLVPQKQHFHYHRATPLRAVATGAVCPVPQVWGVGVYGYHLNNRILSFFHAPACQSKASRSLEWRKPRRLHAYLQKFERQDDCFGVAHRTKGGWNHGGPLPRARHEPSWMEINSFCRRTRCYRRGPTGRSPPG